MSAKIRWSNSALADLNKFIQFYSLTLNRQTAMSIARRLDVEVQILANNPLLGLVEAQYGNEFKYSKILDGQYHVFFKRPNLNVLRLVMLISSNEPMPTLAELRKANK